MRYRAKEKAPPQVLMTPHFQTSLSQINQIDQLNSTPLSFSQLYNSPLT